MIHSNGKHMTPQFDLGATVATPDALELIEAAGQVCGYFIDRHVRGDWGCVSDEDAKLNDAAVKDGGRIMSVYTTLNGEFVWVITEAVGDDGKRAATTILTPGDY